MTAPLLLTWILALLLLQVTLAVAVALWRRAQRPVPVPATQAPARSGPNAAWDGWRAFRVARREAEDAAGSQCSFHLVPVDGLALPAFLPGQFLTFQLPGAGPRGLTRCYSLSDAPQPGRYRVTIKRVPAPATPPGLPPGAASTHFHDQVQVGDVLSVRAPAGHFHLDTGSSTPVVLVAGGIGITPMLSMLGWLVVHQPQRPVHLFYGLRCGAEHAFKDWLHTQAAAHPALQLHVVYSQPAAADQAGRDHQHSGRIDVDLLRRTLPHGPHQFYVCGPPAMMDTLVPALAAWGVPAADLHFEAFGPASVRSLLPVDPGAAPVAVEFRRAGRTIAWDGSDTNLLDFAERHGVVVDSGCRSGGCGSCQTRLLAGSVTYSTAPDCEPAAGSCLLCVGRPAGALSLDA